MLRLDLSLPFMPRKLTLSAVAMFAITTITPAALAQTFTVIHNFTGGADGAEPIAGLTADARGNLYGTANQGGYGTCVPENAGCGVAFKLTPVGSSCVFTPIYSFRGSPDGGGPYGRVIFGPNASGNMYGASPAGGSNNFGALWELSPSGGGWIEHSLYDFQGGSDGVAPAEGLLLNGGTLFGTTQLGPGNAGTAFEPTASGEGWSFSTMTSLPAGEGPFAKLAADSAGNLYGVTQGGDGDYGAVFKLTRSGSGWTMAVLHSFSGARDGNTPLGSLYVDAGGNVYGTTFQGGAYNEGVVFKITP